MYERAVKHLNQAATLVLLARGELPEEEVHEWCRMARLATVCQCQARSLERMRAPRGGGQ